MSTTLSDDDLTYIRRIHQELVNARINADHPKEVLGVAAMQAMAAAYKTTHTGEFDTSEEFIEKVENIVVNNGLEAASKFIAKRVKNYDNEEDSETSD